MEGLTEGRIVHYVLPNGEHRPAIVVKVWRLSQPVLNETDEVIYTAPENGCCNLSVFTDWENDKINFGVGPIIWQTSRLYSENKKPGTWHWIEKA